MKKNSFALLVNDGSIDDTWKQITSAISKYPDCFRGISLARNYGHQAALLCGLDFVAKKCDAAISIDADLQDDINLIPEMITLYKQGYHVVYGVRRSRDVDSWFKRNSAYIFYKLMRVMGVEMIENHADYRLMSKLALHHLQAFPEVNIFLRGIVPFLHNKVTSLVYIRKKRTAGNTKYTLKKMLALGWNGITSFSIVPLRLITLTGFIIFITSIVMTLYALISLILGSTLPGWTSIVIPLYILGGVIMLSIGILGEYVGKVFLETKRRPRFLIDEISTDT